MEEGNINLPPGFQFYPTDEELILDFLYRKASLLPCHPNIIPDLESYSHDPWQLNGKALSSGKQWYFYSQKIQDRTTKNGYWKQFDIDEAICSGSKKVGIKKYFVFYMGEAPEGIETNWIMQEYSLSNSGLSCSTSCKRRSENKILDGSEWVLCRVYERKDSQQGLWYRDEDDDDGTELSCLDEIFLSLDDDLDEISLPNYGFTSATN